MATSDLETREPGTVDDSLGTRVPPSSSTTSAGTGQTATTPGGMPSADMPAAGYETSGTSPSTTGLSSQPEGAGAVVGEAQTSTVEPGNREDLIEVLNDLVECCKDGEYGFHTCAQNAKREDLKAVFTQREQDCQRGALELQDQIRQLGGDVKDSGSVLGALHRGWVSVKSSLTSQDDKATLEDAERGEDNAMARYRKALKQPLPATVRSLVERQMEGVQRNHDQIKMLRDQFAATP